MEQKTPVKIICDVINEINQTTLGDRHTDDESEAFYGLISHLRNALAIVKSETPDDDKAKIECLIKDDLADPGDEYETQAKAILQNLNYLPQK